MLETIFYVLLTIQLYYLFLVNIFSGLGFFKVLIQATAHHGDIRGYANTAP
jgi:hypothetical protein